MAADAKRASRPHPPQMVKCPRCNSSETKFCYYNNYSTTQPRYFCKNCKRYWTDGGTLRNVPVGGGLRKNKRSKTKLNTVLSSPPPTASMHQSQAPSLMPCDNLGGASNSFIPGRVGLPNPSPDVNLGLPLPPNYLLFNPGNYEMDNKSAPITNHLPLYQSDPNIVQHFASPLPLPVLSAGLKNDSALSDAYFTAYPWHQERAMPDSLQAAGGYVSRNENPSTSYTVNNFLNVSDWQQISEGLAGAAGDDNHALMQLSQRPQWTDFAAGTRL